MKVVVLRLDGKPEVIEVPKVYEFARDTFGDLVEAHGIGGRVTMLIDENGRLKNLKPNKDATVLWRILTRSPEEWIVGHVVFSAVSDDGEFDSLTDNEVDGLLGALNKCELIPIDIPDELPEPKCEVVTFDNDEQFQAFLRNRR